MTKRFIKQIAFALAFFSFVWFFSTTLAVIPRIIEILSAGQPSATCSDGIQNQKEVAVDCGGPCTVCAFAPESLLVERVMFLPSDGAYYDMVAVVVNPNTKHGAAVLPYVFLLEGAEGEVLARAEDTSYILPTERRYFVAHGLETQSRTPDRGEFLIKEDGIEWVALNEYHESGLVAENQTFQYLATGGDYAEVSAVTWDRSTFDYDDVDIVVMVYDAFGEPIGVRTTDQHTLRAGERRFFKVTWRRPFAREMARVEIGMYTNLLRDDNYLRRYGVPERFQERR